MIHDIFISYSRRNLQQVIAIRDELKEQVDVDSWIDLKGIESGEQFVNVIIKAIDEAKVVLFMISKDSMLSDYTKKEVMYARNVGKKIVPIVLDGSKLSGWFLFEFGVVDYVDIQDPMQKSKFFDNVRGWLGLTDNDEGPLDFFETGMHYYLKQEYNVAFDWFMKAAKFGKCIGLLHKQGMGVPQNDIEALRWYRKAAENGSTDAKYNIGKCYYYGRGVEIDLKEAAHWFEVTANVGFVKGQSSIAYCYLNGEGVPKDFEKAVMWFEKAAKSGRPTSQYHLGYCYYYGMGVKQDYHKAFYWFEQASEKNHAAAEYYLGLCYYNGYGVPQNLDKARICFRKSVKQGYEEARKYL